jgi:hypothetical protein
MRLLRDAVVSLVHQTGFPRVAARLRYYSEASRRALCRGCGWAKARSFGYNRYYGH